MSAKSLGILLSSVTIWVFVWMAVFNAVGGPAGGPGIVPLPLKMEFRGGVFRLQAGTRILADANARETGRYLADRLGPATGWTLELGAATEPARGNIVLTTRGANAALGAEGYELVVEEDSVLIRAPAPAGLFYGVQSLLQLLPAKILAAKPEGSGDWTIQCVSIEDQPRFAWRGLLLDVSRHFFTKSEVEELMDLMALHKLNHLQMHLTDDQGWRIEIKRYPRLTEVGAWRKGIGFGLDPKASSAYGPDGRYGGYYTQADIRELVAYGASRHIAIVPEIEMPGHSSAALAAYPQFSCSGAGYTTDVGGGIFPGVYCPGNEETFDFLQNVLAEVIEMFPGKYIHIGGDEVPKGNWQKCPKCQARKSAQGLKNEKELQSYFVRRIEKFINSRGRSLMGWSEILEGGLAQNAAVMDWIGGGVEAASAGHDVVMTPTTHCYFDYYQARNQAGEPRAIGGFLPLDKVYSLEPMPAELDARLQSHVLGAQGNLWTEYVPSFKHAQYMIFPRLCALAEVTWSAKDARNYADFARRLGPHLERLDQLGVNYRKGRP
ncbi:MAG: beta-N-acetylhexosaminidase [Limisphaerales bacterium]